MDWRSSIMANSSRDPYWQASVRRETIDHAGDARCRRTSAPSATCRSRVMRPRRAAKRARSSPSCPSGQKNGQMCELGRGWRDLLRLSPDQQDESGDTRKLQRGIRYSFFRARDGHPENGPFVITAGRQLIMQSSTGGFRPTWDDHISRLGALRHLSPALHHRPRRGRQGDRLAPRADAVSGMAAQRLLRRSQLPAVSHA